MTVDYYYEQLEGLGIKLLGWAKGTTILQILFTCDLSKGVFSGSGISGQMHIWQTCKGKRIGGFFLHHGRFYTGFLVGKARQIITLIEKMIRLRWIDRVNVVHERAIGSGVVPGWFEGGLNISDLPPDQAAQVPGLAQLIANEIKARRGN